MNLTKENVVFNLNNILISAFYENEDFRNMLIEENEQIKEFVDDDKILEEYKDYKVGKKIETEKVSEEVSIESVAKNENSGEYVKVFCDCLKLLKKDPEKPELLKIITSTLIKLKAYPVIIKYFIPKLLKHEDDSNALSLIANTYMGMNQFKKSRFYYEKLLEISTNNIERADCYSRLGYLYERIYQDRNIDKQIAYTKKALGYGNCDSTLYAFLGRLFYRKGDIPTATKCFEIMKQNNPNIEDIIVYSRFLMKQGLLTEAYDIYRKRFETGRVTYPHVLSEEKRWDGTTDLSDSTVIVHYEQGFGDSVMFSRYVSDIAKMAKKTIFVVQKTLIPLFQASGYEDFCELLSHEADINPNTKLKTDKRSIMFSSGQGMTRIPHDYHIPLMDSAYLLKESSDNIRHAEGYLSVPQEKIEKFRKKHIKKNKKIKIGLAYHGTKDSVQTNRDIPLKKFIPLLKLKGVEFYSFQADEYAKQLNDLDSSIKIYNLAQHFQDFEDTACAMNCMDLIITTDNVILNLAGALGIKTYGMFNIFSESRWFKTEGEDVGWYKSVRPFRAKHFKSWDELIKRIVSAVKEDFNL